MKKYTKLALPLLFLAVLSIGCKDNVSSSRPVPEDIIFSSQQNGLFTMTIGDDGFVYAAGIDINVARYTYDGQLLKMYQKTEGMRGLYYANDFIYGFTYSDDDNSIDIMELDPQSGNIRTVYQDLSAFNISSFSVLDNHIYAVIIPPVDVNHIHFEQDGDYTNMKELFISVDIKSGELSEITAVTQPITHYQANNGNIYIYSRSNNIYILQEYNTETGKVIDVSVIDGVGYLFAFAYESDYFIFANNDVRVKDMLNDMIYIVSDSYPSVFGGCFSYYYGNIIYLDQKEDKGSELLLNGEITNLKTSIKTIRLNSDYAVLANSGEDNGSIIISAPGYHMLFMIDDIYSESGIKGIYVDQPGTTNEINEFTTSILAGDDSIDIYILYFNNDVARAISQQGRYISLNDSIPIQDYLSRCFDWISDSARAPNGDTWMLPLYFDAPILWYIPDNFDYFSLTPDDVIIFDIYVETVKRIEQQNAEYTTHANFLSNLYHNWVSQYEMTYNDYENGHVSFQTDVFKHFFDIMWSGYDRNEAMHPTLQKNLDYRYDNTTHKVFTLEYLSWFPDSYGTDMTQWRALPMPRITEKVNRNYFTTVFAVVNPYSQNIELAIKFLETVASNMMTYINKPIYPYKDISAYEGYVDMSIPVYQDIYDIFTNGAVIKPTFPDGYEFMVNDYQLGKITLDDAINSLQRSAEMWLFE